ncbi:zf-HC2 domain-containing protein, partial [Streptomyces sp. 4N509B]|uniref:zf-HC2 domain-containing protein n=1 Tax=Streptomyces sp. 4N509B TaxID=3457413 RepID=UPI003FCEE8D9
AHPTSPRGARHQELMSLLGAWALAACQPEESERVEAHLNDCAPCADEAMRLRDAATLLEPQRGLDLDHDLRPRVLDACLARRSARVPVPSWAAPYDAEVARLDTLLIDFAADEWRTPVTLRWYGGGAWPSRATTVAGVIDHLHAVDGLLARAVGLPDPLAEPVDPAASDPDTGRGPGPGPGTGEPTRPAGPGTTAGPGEGAGGESTPEARAPEPAQVPLDPTARTLARWSRQRSPEGDATARDPETATRTPWREQSRALVRAAARVGGRTGERTMSHAAYGDPGLFTADPGTGELALSDAYLDRAFACWIHAMDVAHAVSYPYDPPPGAHLRLLVDLTARRLPGSVARRRRAGLAHLARGLTTAGRPGRILHLEVEGSGGGDFYIALDSPAATVTRAEAREAVAHVALDDVQFCQLASGRISPEEAAESAGVVGDEDAVRDVLFAAADLSRL